MTIRLTFLVDSPSKRAHGNAASRLALGLVQSGQVEATLLCYSSDPAPTWLPPEVRVQRLGVDRVSRSLPGLVRYLRDSKPDVLVTRQVHANLVGIAASYLARVPSGWHGKLVLVQDHPIELSHAANRRDNKWLAKLTYRFADGLISPPRPSGKIPSAGVGSIHRLQRWSPIRSRSSLARSIRLRTHGSEKTSRLFSCTPPT